MKLSELKIKIKDYGKSQEQLIRENPEYADALDRLQSLNAQRERLVAQLQQVDINIDMILAMIGANEEKKVLDKKVNK